MKQYGTVEIYTIEVDYYKAIAFDCIFFKWEDPATNETRVDFVCGVDMPIDEMISTLKSYVNVDGALKALLDYIDKINTSENPQVTYEYDADAHTLAVTVCHSMLDGKCKDSTTRTLTLSKESNDRYGQVSFLIEWLAFNI